MIKIRISTRKYAMTSVVLLLSMFISSCSYFEPQDYINHHLQDHSLIIESKFGEIKYTALSTGSIEVHYLQTGVEQLPSFATKEASGSVPLKITESDSVLTLTNGNLSAIINKDDLSVNFYRDDELLVKQKSYFHKLDKAGFNFQLDDSENIMGGGERVLGMDRRGHRMPLYNKAHYGYTTESNQMYFSLPLVISSKKYAILFDNSASGFLDIGKTENNTLSFEAVGGRTAYMIFSGESYPELINHYVDVTGKQPLPPRWAFGNYASRFGYKTEQQVRETVAQFIADDIPLDAIILDLYWFGNDIKGFMGNLDWDKKAFPTPAKMISDLKEKGVKTILITEPFILSTSDKWQDAVDNKILAKNEKGEPRRFDFYFGNTGLIDVFDSKAQDWFGEVYKDLTEQGVAGVWGDLGEPEVHPDDSLHFLSDIGKTGRGDEVHNAYGHQWAKMVYQNQLKLQPNVRPFIMMRSGFAGSQRYGMIPWTGDVSRSWDGLKPQVELSLQMGLSGMAYTHSDLGGFAGGEAFDQELYIRWLQYGVFQPVFRPHAQDNIAPEPVFHDQQTKDIIRKYIKLRYRLLSYNYTMAYENSISGMPLMRPIFFEDESKSELIDVKDSYLWGDAFLVSPIVKSNEKQHPVNLPEGVWFDFWNDNRFDGNQTVNLPVTLQNLPVLVRGGSFIPMVDAVQSIDDYSSEHLTLHYYADEKITQSKGQMYEDDGASFNSIADGKFELLQFLSMQKGSVLRLDFSRIGKGYQTMTQQRKLDIVIHNWVNKPQSIRFAGNNVSENDYSYDSELNKLSVKVRWDHQTTQLLID